MRTLIGIWEQYTKYYLRGCSRHQERTLTKQRNSKTTPQGKGDEKRKRDDGNDEKHPQE